MNEAASGKAREAGLARTLVRSAWKATLATISRHGGNPYASLVAIATEADGAPLLLLSGLAEHTRNIAADQRVSLLVDGTEPGRAALTGARVTLVGRITGIESQRARQRYLRRHPDAAGFMDFADFGLYRLEVEWAHLVAGFGRIERLAAADVLLDVAGADSLLEAEADIVSHMNDDHADAVQLFAAHSGGGPWRMIGCDPEGCDLTDGDKALRLTFSTRIGSPAEARAELVRMTVAARQPRQSSQSR